MSEYTERRKPGLISHEITVIVYIHTYIHTFIRTKGPLWPLTMLCELKVSCIVSEI